jgi:LysM repeat protein
MEPNAKPAPAAKSAQAAAKPAQDAKTAPTAAKPAQTAAKPAASGAKSVKVGAGDTIYSLARKNNISVDELCKANGIGPDAKIQVGRTLRIP